VYIIEPLRDAGHSGAVLFFARRSENHRKIHIIIKKYRKSLLETGIAFSKREEKCKKKSDKPCKKTGHRIRILLKNQRLRFTKVPFKEGGRKAAEEPKSEEEERKFMRRKKWLSSILAAAMIQMERPDLPR